MKHQYIKNTYNFNKLINVARRFMVLRGLRCSSRLENAFFSSKLIAVGCTPLGGSWGDRKKVWMLGKDGLTEDFLASSIENEWMIPIEFSRGIPKVIAQHYLPAGVDDNTYATSDAGIENDKWKYREAWREIFKALSTSNRPDAITTGNFGYYAERELAKAAELENIPFIAMHKECLKSDGRLAFFKTVYQRRGKFEGRKIIVYNNRERQLQIDAGVARPDQVLVCGMPRLDRQHQWREQSFQRPDRPTTLLALGFTQKTGLPRIPRKGIETTQATYEYLTPEHEKMGWNNLFQNYHEALVKIAYDNPQWLVQLKLKARYRDAEPSVKLMKELNAPENLQIVVGGDPFKLLQGADVVTGFNTTAILEGLAAGLPVVTPQFDEVIEPGMSDFAATFENATYTPNDPSSMYLILTELMKSRKERQKILSDDVLETLDLWVGNPDGKSGERVRHAFEQEIVRSQ